MILGMLVGAGLLIVGVVVGVFVTALGASMAQTGSNSRSIDL